MPAVVAAAPSAALAAASGALAWVNLGSIAAVDWLPYAMLAALVVAAVAAAGAAFVPPRAALAGVGALVLLAAWDAISELWAVVPGLAHDEALLTLFYASALAVPLLTVRRGRARLLASAAVVAAPAVLAVATAVKLRFGAGPADLYYGGRLNFPVSYVNGDAAFFLVSFWPAVALAARRATPLVARAPALAAAAAVSAAGVMTQSKGGVLGIAVSAVIVFALGPGRLRLLVPALLAAAPAAIAVRPLTAPYRADTHHVLVGAIRHAGTTLLVVAAVALGVGIAYALLDRRIELRKRERRIGGVVALAALAAALAGGAGIFFARVDHPVAYASHKWRDFKHPSTGEQGSTHLLALGSNRYDFWRVAIHDFERHPVAGTGSRSFVASYLERRRSPETPARPHSLPLDALSETGLVGLVLLVVGVGAPLAACIRRRADLAALGAVGAATYWLTHATVDWIWTIPAVGLPFFLLVGIGASTDTDAAVGRRARAGAVVASALAAVVLFAPPWLAARLTSRGVASGSENDLRWARRLDPMSLDPLFAQFRVVRSHRRRLAIARKAVSIAPGWVGAQYLLGVAYLENGDRARAREHLRRALRLDPHERRIAAELRRAER